MQARRTLGRLTKQQQKAETEAQAAAAEALVSSTNGGASRLTRSSAVSVASGPRSHVYDGAPPRVPPVRTPAEVADLAMRRRQRKIEDALRVAKRAELTQQLRAAQERPTRRRVRGRVCRHPRRRHAASRVVARARCGAHEPPAAGGARRLDGRRLRARVPSRATTRHARRRRRAGARAAAGPACQAAAARPSTAPFMSQKRRQRSRPAGAGQGPPPGAKPPTATAAAAAPAARRRGCRACGHSRPRARALPAFSPALDREARTKMIVRGLYKM